MIINTPIHAKLIKNDMYVFIIEFVLSMAVNRLVIDIKINKHAYLLYSFYLITSHNNGHPLQHLAAYTGNPTINVR